MDLLKLFDQTSEVEIFPAGSVIFATGEAAAKMYVVIEGQVEIRSGDKVLERAGPGAAIGEMALIGNHVRTATVAAATDCRLAPVTERRFLFMVQQTPFFALHIMRVLVERIVRKESTAP